MGKTVAIVPKIGTLEADFFYFCFKREMKMKRTGICKTIMIAAAVLLVSCEGKPGQYREVSGLKSPDGSLAMSFALDSKGAPCYRLDRLGEAVILPSRLGFDLMDGSSLREGFSVVKVETDSLDEVWNPVWGEEESIRNHYNEALVTLRDSLGRVMKVRFRLFDEGLGFRYEFPMENALSYFDIKEEITQFALTGDHTAWWISGDYDTQEYNYTRSFPGLPAAMTASGLITPRRRASLPGECRPPSR